MLRKLSVKNFRLLRDVTIDVEPGKPIVLIGPNGSGKSSVIQVLDLLSRWAEEGFEAGCRAFGGIKSFAADETAAVTIEVELDDQGTVRHSSPWSRLAYRVTFSRAVEIQSEALLGQNTTDRELLSRDESEISLWNLRTKTHDTQQVQSDRLSFEAYRQPLLYPGLSDLGKALDRLRIYDGFLTTPLWTRDPREGQLSPFNGDVVSAVPRVGRRGIDLVNALYYIQQNHGDVWDDLMDSFRAEFPFVQRLEFPADPAGGRIALAFRDKRYPGVRMQGHQMSEGMATYLCLLAAILSPEPAAALAFDEPDRHLHPSALRRVAYLLERASERTAVFVATHSDRFLDYLSDPAGSIRICEPTPEGVKLSTLNRDALDAWRALYSMSTLRERGQIDPSNDTEIEP